MQMRLLLVLFCCLLGSSCLAGRSEERFKKENLKDIKMIDLGVPDVVSYISVASKLSGVDNLRVEIDFNVPTVKGMGSQKYDAEFKTTVQNYANTIKKQLLEKKFLFQYARVNLEINKISFFDLLSLISNMTGMFVTYRDDVAVLSAFPVELFIDEYEYSDDLAFAFRDESLDHLILGLTSVVVDNAKYYAEVKNKRLFLIASEELHCKMRSGLKEWNEQRVQKSAKGDPPN